MVHESLLYIDERKAHWAHLELDHHHQPRGRRFGGNKTRGAELGGLGSVLDRSPSRLSPHHKRKQQRRLASATQSSNSRVLRGSKRIREGQRGGGGRVDGHSRIGGGRSDSQSLPDISRSPVPSHLVVKAKAKAAEEEQQQEEAAAEKEEEEEEEEEQQQQEQEEEDMDDIGWQALDTGHPDLEASPTHGGVGDWQQGKQGQRSGQNERHNGGRNA